jgi:hypothetical protein
VVKSERLDGPAIAVAIGGGSIWALDSAGTLYRLDPSSSTIAKRIPLPVRAAYNIWTAAGQSDRRQHQRPALSPAVGERR